MLQNLRHKGCNDILQEIFQIKTMTNFQNTKERIKDPKKKLLFKFHAVDIFNRA